MPAHTARVVNEARAAGGRVIAVGTTAVRALETAAAAGRCRPGAGLDRPGRDAGDGVRVVDGLLTGFHEPRASHLDMLAAVAGHACSARATRQAVDAGYLWHEFGDVNLLLPAERAGRPGAQLADQNRGGRGHHHHVEQQLDS